MAGYESLKKKRNPSSDITSQAVCKRKPGNLKYKGCVSVSTFSPLLNLYGASVVNQLLSWILERGRRRDKP